MHDTFCSSTHAATKAYWKIYYLIRTPAPSSLSGAQGGFGFSGHQPIPVRPCQQFLALQVDHFGVPSFAYHQAHQGPLALNPMGQIRNHLVACPGKLHSPHQAPEQLWLPGYPPIKAAKLPPSTQQQRDHRCQQRVDDTVRQKPNLKQQACSVGHVSVLFGATCESCPHLHSQKDPRDQRSQQVEGCPHCPPRPHQCHQWPSVPLHSAKTGLSQGLSQGASLPPHWHQACLEPLSSPG